MKPPPVCGRRDAGAFTLLETLIAIFVGVLAAILLFRSVGLVGRAESREAAIGDARQEAARMLARMTRDLRSASGFETTTSGFSLSVIELDGQARPAPGRVVYEPAGNRWVRRGGHGADETFVFPAPEVPGGGVRVRLELASPTTARCSIVLGSGSRSFALGETVQLGGREPEATGRDEDDGSGSGGAAP